LITELGELTAARVKDKLYIGELEASKKTLQQKISAWDTAAVTEDIRVKVLDVNILK
jgi:hypothetical protein